MLDNLGLWDSVERRRCCAFTGMKVWDAGSASELFLEHTAVGLPELGHIVENDLVVDSAWQALTDVDIYCPAMLESLAIETDAAHLHLDDGSTIKAALVVGAEGANSPVRMCAVSKKGRQPASMK